MDAARWQQVKAIFQEALERPPSERGAFLEDACGGDQELLAEVQSLLVSDEHAEGFLDVPALDPEEEDEHDPFIGMQVGVYRLRSLLGRGGMGAVYLGERVEGDFEQQAAIKLIHAGLRSPELRRRFHTERQVLARLQHPNIARLLDGGVTEDGVPYIVMEHVDGLPLTDYCDLHCLDTDARLDLFLTVCDAVRYAHRNLIVHRDLKPRNILVDTEGRVKLLDFGIAKLLDEEPSAEGPVTTGLRVMTPEYAAPEQVRGEPVTTATDVYALGIVLYEVLTGQRPYRLSSSAPSEIERVICGTDPARPSTMITRAASADDPPTTRPVTPEEIGAARSTAPDRLRRRLTGDLDVICLKALRKEPGRRYASAEQLADDLRRHLDGLPVTARPDTLRYRATKFIQRHKVGVVAATLVILALVGGIVATAWQARVAAAERDRAERRFDDVRNLANTFLFEFHDAIVDLPGSTPARELVATRALEYLDELAREAEDHPVLPIELAQAYRRVGDVLGNPTNPNLGHTERALASYRKGLDVLERATVLRGAARPPAAHVAKAELYESLGDVLGARGDLAAADSMIQTAVVSYQQLAAAHPDSIPHQVRYAVGLIKRGDLAGNDNFNNRGDPATALGAYQQALPLLERSRRLAPENPRPFRLHGLIYERLGTIYEQQDSLRAALAAYRRSLELREAFVTAYPNHVEGQRDLAVAYEKMADMYVHQRRPAEALRHYRQAHRLFEALLEADPQNASARVTLAISHLHQGDVVGFETAAHLGNRSAALRHYRAALDLLDAAHADDPTNSRTAWLRDLLRGRIDGLS
ncbi:MAG: protein kinase [Bacteroidetes bacterium]|jgi:non-specific serine/threonine protein kinase/serine/threonine-protein kinase|nr:protein kinase [Bacteroidota bacterium]